MRDLTSLHTQLAAKTSKVNRDVYSTNPPTTKPRSDATGGPSSAGGRAGGPGYDAAGAQQGSPYGQPPGLAYHQIPGYPPQSHGGYSMLPPGQYEGYHPNYYPANPGQQGQPYPTYPPSFGPPPPGAVSPGYMAYPPYAQAQYPPVSPSESRCSAKQMVGAQNQGC